MTLPPHHDTAALTKETMYEQDYCLWLEKTASLLRDGRLHELDIPNLVEEIEDMGRSERQAVKSNLIVVLIHLLKYKYQPSKRSGSWKSSIREHRRRLGESLADSPSLKPYLREVFQKCYGEACLQAVDETGLPLETFPAESPFTPNDALNPNYLPE